MIQSSLRPFILTTAGYIMIASVACTLGVPQGSKLSPSLFSIFMDPLARTLHPSGDPSAMPSNALLAEPDCVGFFKTNWISIQHGLPPTTG